MADKKRTRTQIFAPGRRVHGSRTGRPVMVLLDLLGRRWVLRILWELRDGPLNWRALRQACDNVSPSVLQQRLDDLRGARIVELRAREGYALTTEGRRLMRALAPVNDWAAEWARKGLEPQS